LFLLSFLHYVKKIGNPASRSPGGRRRAREGRRPRFAPSLFTENFPVKFESGKLLPLRPRAPHGALGLVPGACLAMLRRPR